MIFLWAEIILHLTFRCLNHLKSYLWTKLSGFKEIPEKKKKNLWINFFVTCCLLKYFSLDRVQSFQSSKTSNFLPLHEIWLTGPPTSRPDGFNFCHMLLLYQYRIKEIISAEPQMFLKYLFYSQCQNNYFLKSL